MLSIRRLVAVALLGLAVVAGQVASAQEAAKLQGAVDQRALDVLKKMSDTLSKAGTMSFQARSMVPVKAPFGIWINLYGVYKVEMQAPGKLFVKQSGDLAGLEFYFDGNSITMYSPDKNLFAVKKAPATVNDLIEDGYEKDGKSFPFSDMLVADPYAVLTQDMTAAYYVGQSTIIPLHGTEGVKADHLAISNKGVDWQIWIDQANGLPVLVTATYKGPENEPSYNVEFGAWKLNEPIAEGVFVFDNKAKAAKVDYRDPFAPRGPGPKDEGPAKPAEGV